MTAFQTFSDSLPSQASSPANTITWKPGTTPGTGLLAIHTARTATVYTVEEFDTPWPGRAFHLVKSGDAYDVFIPANGQDFSCSCAGFCYGRGKPCKHILACTALTRLELVNPDADHANTEVHEQEEPQIPHIETLDEALARTAAAKPVAKPIDWSRIEAAFA